MSALQPYLTNNLDLFQLQVKQPKVTTHIRSYINAEYEVSIKTKDETQCYEYLGIKSDFGPKTIEIEKGDIYIFSDEENLYGCKEYNKKDIESIKDKILIISRGRCNFLDKVIYAEKAGAKAVIFLNNQEGNQEFRIINNQPSIIVKIPSLIINYKDALSLLKTNYKQLQSLKVNDLPSIHTDSTITISLFYLGKRINNVVIINV